MKIGFVKIWLVNLVFNSDFMKIKIMSISTNGYFWVNWYNVPIFIDLRHNSMVYIVFMAVKFINYTPKFW